MDPLSPAYRRLEVEIRRQHLVRVQKAAFSRRVKAPLLLAGVVLVASLNVIAVGRTLADAGLPAGFGLVSGLLLFGLGIALYRRMLWEWRQPEPILTYRPPADLLVSFGPDLNVYNDGSVVTAHTRFPLPGTRWSMQAQAYTSHSAMMIQGAGVAIGPVGIVSASAATAYSIGQQIAVTVTAPDGLRAAIVTEGLADTTDWTRQWVNWLNAAGSGHIQPNG